MIRGIAILGFVLMSCSSTKQRGVVADYSGLSQRCAENEALACKTLQYECANHDIAEACLVIGKIKLQSDNPSAGLGYISIGCDEGSEEACEMTKKHLDNFAEETSKHIIDESLRRKVYKANRKKGYNHIGQYKHAIRNGNERPIDSAPLISPASIEPAQNFIKGFQPDKKQETNCTSQPQYLFGKFNGYKTVCN